MADAPRRNRIQIECPSCGNSQSEPALVVSTQCRACGEHFKIEDGKAVPRLKPSTLLVKARQEDPAHSSHPEPVESPSSSFSPFHKTATPTRPKPSLLARLFHPAKPPREILCLRCQHEYHASADAQSSQCPKCGGYISLQDYEIHESWHRRIETQGNVIIQKSGSVSGVAIHCHDLTVLGELSGSVVCSGSFIIRNHCKILGKVRCKHLRVEKGARVEFLNPVLATTAQIDGIVTGQIECSGAVTLAKRSHLTGTVKTSSLIVKPGAKHTGSIEMIAKR
ncbi:MAG: polymer-forming cytoskeletal protein [Luteolibacter sp.]